MKYNKKLILRSVALIVIQAFLTLDVAGNIPQGESVPAQISHLSPGLSINTQDIQGVLRNFAGVSDEAIVQYENVTREGAIPWRSYAVRIVGITTVMMGIGIAAALGQWGTAIILVGLAAVAGYLSWLSRDQEEKSQEKKVSSIRKGIGRRSFVLTALLGTLFLATPSFAAKRPSNGTSKTQTGKPKSKVKSKPPSPKRFNIVLKGDDAQLEKFSLDLVNSGFPYKDYLMDAGDRIIIALGDPEDDVKQIVEGIQRTYKNRYKVSIEKEVARTSWEESLTYTQMNNFIDTLVNILKKELEERNRLLEEYSDIEEIYNYYSDPSNKKRLLDYIEALTFAESRFRHLDWNEITQKYELFSSRTGAKGITQLLPPAVKDVANWYAASNGKSLRGLVTRALLNSIKVNRGSGNINKVIELKKILGECSNPEELGLCLNELKKEKIVNQYIGYLYYWHALERAKRFELGELSPPDETGNKFELNEKADPMTDRGVNVFMAAAAMYNAGPSIKIQAALKRHGPKDWYTNIISTEIDPREPIRYVRVILDYMAKQGRSFTKDELAAREILIENHYSRLMITEKGDLKENSDIVPDENKKDNKKDNKKNNKKVPAYKTFDRTDNFDVELATKLALFLGTGTVDDFIRGVARKNYHNKRSPDGWEKELLNYVKLPELPQPLWMKLAEVIEELEPNHAYFNQGSDVIQRLRQRNLLNRVQAVKFAEIQEDLASKAKVAVEEAEVAAKKRGIDYTKALSLSAVLTMAIYLTYRGVCRLWERREEVSQADKEGARPNRRVEKTKLRQRSVSSWRKLVNTLTQRGALRNRWFLIVLGSGILLSLFVPEFISLTLAQGTGGLQEGVGVPDLIARIIESVPWAAAMMPIQIDESDRMAAQPSDGAGGADEITDLERIVYGFESGTLDTAIFIDVDLLRLKNQIISKAGSNIFLEYLLQEREQTAKSQMKEKGKDAAMTWRRGGDEFVLLLKTDGDKGMARAIAKEMKQEVEAFRLGVACLDYAGDIDPAVQKIIKATYAAQVEKVGTKNILLVPLARGADARFELNNVLESINCQLEPSWLDNIGNEVSFSVSVGVAVSSEAQDVTGENAFEKTLNYAASRKDHAKKEFQRTGKSSIHDSEPFVAVQEGESILSDEAKKIMTFFKELEMRANSSEGKKSGVRPKGIPHIRYFAGDKAARHYIADKLKRNDAGLSGAVAVQVQAFGYNDEIGKIIGYLAGYEARGGITDDRLRIRDIKVVNEAWGYPAGDETIALLRILIMGFPGFKQYEEVIFVRGPLAGPFLVLIPKSGLVEVTKQTTEEFLETLVDYIKQQFNKNSKVKVGYIWGTWDYLTAGSDPMGNVMSRLTRTRVAREADSKFDLGEVPKILQAEGEYAEKRWLVLREEDAKGATKILIDLQFRWPMPDAVKNKFLYGQGLEEISLALLEASI